jgi:hypothetical protein
MFRITAKAIGAMVIVTLITTINVQGQNAPPKKPIKTAGSESGPGINKSIIRMKLIKLNY